MDLTSKLFKKAGLEIRKMRSEEVDAVIGIAFESFKGKLSMPLADLKEEIMGDLSGNFSSCYVAVLDDEIVGAYLLRKGVTPEVIKEIPVLGTLHQNKRKGYQGVALFVLPKYQGTGIGKSLRGIPESLGADFVWGMHYKDLNNMENWVRNGRAIVQEADTFFVTLKEFPENQRVNVEKKQETLKEEYKKAVEKYQVDTHTKYTFIEAHLKELWETSAIQDLYGEHRNHGLVDTADKSDWPDNLRIEFEKLVEESKKSGRRLRLLKARMERSNEVPKT